MKTEDFFYELPKERIAQDPLLDRSSSRLMILDRRSGRFSHDTFRNVGAYLHSGDLLVLNDTKVIPARLIGEKKDSGGRAELLLLTRKECDIWECLAKPGKRLRTGSGIVFGDGILNAVVIRELSDGRRVVKFQYEGIFEEILDRLGQMPLPPYITNKLADKTRYNTVYAAHDGSAAAPTAGLHFTEDLLEELRAAGVETAFVTLHVGLGTFRPVKASKVEEHEMHSEFYQISDDTAEKINRAKQDGRRVICVGTTSCRTIESAAGPDGSVQAGSGWTDIFIYPGYTFRVMDGLITNFHLPESTLLMLVSAFAGRENVLAAYREAVEKEYRFFSFGDAMLIE